MPFNSKRQTLSLELAEAIGSLSKSWRPFWKKRNSAEFARLLNEHDPACVNKIAWEIRLELPRHKWSVGFEYSCNSTRRQAKRMVSSMERQAPGASIILTTSGSGYAREEAIFNISSVSGPFELALLLLRLNDWVEPVQIAAQRKLEELLELDPKHSGLTADTILGCIELILNRDRFGRAAPSSLKLLHQLPLHAEITEGLRSLVFHGTGKNSPILLRLALRDGTLDSHLPNIAKNARHHHTRLIATRALLHGQAIWISQHGVPTRALQSAPDPEDIAEWALQDHNTSIQKAALDYVLSNRLSAHYTEEMFREFLLEDNPSILERSVFGLKSLGVDIVEEIRQKCHHAPSPAFATILGRYGTSNDADCLLAAAETEDVGSIRYLENAARLGSEQAANRLRKIALHSPNLVTARRASKTLLRLGIGFTFHELRSAFSANGKTVPGLHKFIPALSALPMVHLIALIQINDPKVDYEDLWVLAAQKRARNAFSPSREEIAALRADIGDNAYVLERAQSVLGIELII